MIIKRCGGCGLDMPVKKYQLRRGKPISLCKDCESLRKTNYYRTVNGLINSIFSRQKRRSLINFNANICYSNAELKEWIMSNDKFFDLYNDWVKSGYEKYMSPSVDRINDYKNYSLDNIQLMKWKDNFNKYNNDLKKCINTKITKSVIMKDLKDNIVKEYKSIRSAERDTKIHCTNIVAVCRNIRNTAGGYKWEYKYN